MSFNVILKPFYKLTLNSGKSSKRVYHRQLLYGCLLFNTDDNVHVVIEACTKTIQTAVTGMTKNG